MRILQPKSLMFALLVGVAFHTGRAEPLITTCFSIFTAAVQRLPSPEDLNNPALCPILNRFMKCVSSGASPPSNETLAEVQKMLDDKVGRNTCKLDPSGMVDVNYTALANDEKTDECLNTFSDGVEKIVREQQSPNKNCPLYENYVVCVCKRDERQLNESDVATRAAEFLNAAGATCQVDASDLVAQCNDAGTFPSGAGRWCAQGLFVALVSKLVLLVY